MKKIKSSEIKNIHDSLGKLITNHFPDFRVAVKLAKVAKELDTIFQIFTNQETSIMKKYMKVDNNGNFIIKDQRLVPIKNDDESIKKLNKELNDLYATEVELESLSTPLTIDTPSGLEGITPRDIMILEAIIIFNFDEPCDQPQAENKPVA